jgi:hypothetical protein
VTACRSPLVEDRFPAAGNVRRNAGKIIRTLGIIIRECGKIIPMLGTILRSFGKISRRVG